MNPVTSKKTALTFDSIEPESGLRAALGRSRAGRHACIQSAGEDCRLQALADFARAARGLTWTKPLFLLLLDELCVGDEFDEIIGPPERLPVARYPGAIAFAVALRHSWRPDDLHQVRGALGLRDAAH